MKKITLLLLLFISLGCKEEKKTIDNSNVDKLEGISNVVNLKGEVIKKFEFIGKRVLINYWATWCEPCVKEMPQLLKAQKELLKENYVFLLISDESLEDIKKFKESTGYNFTYLKSKVSLNSLGVYALPTTFIYNVKGEKVDRIVGVVDWNSKEILNKLKAIK